MHMFYGLIIHQEFRDTAKKEHGAGATFGCTINVSQNAGFSGLPAIL